MIAASSGSSFFLIIIVAFLVLYLIVVRPQRRRQSQQQQMLSDLEVGDEVLTAGGIYGTVRELDDDRVTVEIAPKLEVQVARRAIAGVTVEPEPEEGPEEPEEGPEEHEEPVAAVEEPEDDKDPNGVTSDEENRG